MSDLKQIQTALDKHFVQDGNRIVFWNDPEREFESMLPSLMLTLGDINVERLDQRGALEVKVLVEKEKPTEKFLLYSPSEEPDPESDWLLDIRSYSPYFRADRASVLLQELGLRSQHLRQHIAERRKFFDNKERLQKLKTLVSADDSAADLDRKMLAVVCRAEQPELFNIIRTLFHAWTEVGADIDLDTPPAAWDMIEKFDLDKSFWQMIKATFGFEDAKGEAVEAPTLKMLLMRMMATDFAQHLRADPPAEYASSLLNRSGWSNTVVCLAQWRDSNSKGSSYEQLSARIAQLLCVEVYLPKYDIPALLDVMTFLDVEKAIAALLRDQVLHTAATINADDIRSIASRRQAGHWASLALPDAKDAPRKAFHAVYDALIAAADFYALRNQYQHGFSDGDAHAMYKHYEQELFQFDRLYRHFCENADTAGTWGILKTLRTEIENCYVTWYLTALALPWGKFIEPKDGMLAQWRLTGIPNQYEFFARNIQPYLDEADNRRAFVIISDAFRYEAAHELTAELNGKYRFQADLSSQLGVLPSYTALGMASLLPHKKLAYNGKGEVLADGHSTISSERDAILKKVGGAHCFAEDLLKMKKDEGREFIKDKRVVYIYHNTLDATGDNASTEGNTFQAVRQTINELAALIGYVVNNLNGHHVVVTADHGFLFTETSPGETDKSKLASKPDGTVIAKKRYLLGKKLPKPENAWHGKTSATANADGDMEFWIPRGANRFHFAGGARFIHGGAMPQEIVVPVITVKHIRGKSAEVTKTKPVTVQVLGSNHRITTGRHRFQLLQMEPVSDRVTALTIKAAVYDNAEEAVTNVETVKFDSQSDNMEERKKWVNLILKDIAYDKKKAYKLVLRDAGTNFDLMRVDVTIDRAITDDF